jgi:hypothetical protein
MAVFSFVDDNALVVGVEGGSHFAGAKCFALRMPEYMLPVGKGRR